MPGEDQRLGPLTRDSQTGGRRGRAHAEDEARAADWPPAHRQIPGVHPRSLQYWRTKSESDRKRRGHVDSKSSTQYNALLLTFCWGFFPF